ncbi:hypothetical protein LZ554_000734 [Drepanopeziza brunnea f. sp. 'monogermtubi']|nr:hypothetical protein LZ554_000734 [Drepanopeziza brunnea f. sp. 'monogermtubi']
MEKPIKFSSTQATQRILSLTNHLRDSLNPADDIQKAKDTQAAEMATEAPKFAGWVGLDKESVKGKMVWQEFEPKTWTEDDVDIKITHCGICGSDLHVLRSGWGPTLYGCVVGHEICGTAVRVGKNVKHIKAGDRVGIGAQSGSCLDCEECIEGNEMYCKGMIGTYNSKYPDGSKSYGGYADFCRAPAHFAVKIPDELSNADAATMMCGGVTVWSPLTKNGNIKGKRVGIIGIGGLGHFGLLWAKALGASEVVAISRSDSKKADAMKMGATKFIATQDEGWANKNSRSIDLLVSTVSSPDMPLAQFFQLLRTNGQFIQVGAPEDVFPPFSAFALIAKGVKMGGSLIGSPKDISDMLEFAVKHNIRPWIQERPMKDANTAIVDMENGKAKYRYVLVNEKHAAEEKTS